MKFTQTFTASALAASAAAATLTVDQTVLVLARSADEGTNAALAFNAHGIPYQTLIVPQAGIDLPVLNSSATHGNYGAVVMLSELSYSYSSTNWSSALTTGQLQQIYDYQTAFGVRMARLDVYPGPNFGATTAIAGAGCCGANTEQFIYISDDTEFPTAKLKTGANSSTIGLYHYPATITDSATTKEIAQFAPDAAGAYSGPTTAGVINNFSGREQMVFFIGWAPVWSATNNLLNHAVVHWLTRGFFVGSRKLYFTPQIDDVHLATTTYYPGYDFRLSPSDLENIADWQDDLNSRLPVGSAVLIELGHNGAGDIENATTSSYNDDVDPCNPVDCVYPDEQPDTPLEFQKPLGSGKDFWPPTPTNYTWSHQCQIVDPLANWFAQPKNRDRYAHISHTFTHLDFDNSTYSDTYKEIQFNQAWLKQIGIMDGKFSHGLIPPAITGMHNGDAIRAWMDLGIVTVVGDNSRSVLMNQENPYWPLNSTVESNGFAGLNIMPRWPSTIYYNCDTPECDNNEWHAIAQGSGDFNAQLEYEKTVTMKYLLGLRQDPFMFHQANLRTDQPSQVIGGIEVHALLQRWVETITQDLVRLVDWPLVSKQHDELGQLFLEREARDKCKPLLTYTVMSGGNGTTGQITGGTVTTGSGNACSAPIGITVPGTATTSGGSVTSDKVGAEPLILWAQMSGSPVSVTLGSSLATQ